MNDDGRVHGADEGGEGKGGRTAYRPIGRLVGAASAGESGGSKILLLCAEPGLGKTHMLLELLGKRAKAGGDTRLLNLDGEGVNAPELLMRFCRSCASAARGAGRLTVAVDNLPPGDECEVGKEGRALRRMAIAGCDVIVAFRPEAGAIADELVEACTLRSGDLAWSERELHAEDERLWALTMGIPALVHTARAELRGPGQIGQSGRYYEQLRNVASESLRRGLTQEERRMRLAMLLLGTGTMSDLRVVCERLDADALTWLRRDAPLFGVDGRAESFATLPMMPRVALDACADVLRAKMRDIEGGEQVVAAAADLLASQGDYQRAAYACALDPEAGPIAEACRSWGCEFVASGELRVVRRSLQLEAGPEDAPLDECGRYALDTAELPQGDGGGEPSLFLMPHGALAPRSARCVTHGRLLKLCRERRSNGDASILPAGGGALPPDALEQDALSAALALHARARGLLLRGRAYDAFCLLVNASGRSEGLGLASALLADDYEIAQILSGEVPDREDSGCFASAIKTIRHSGCERLIAYRDLLEPALAVLAGGSTDLPHIEHGISKAEAQGDGLTRAAFLIAALVADIRKKALPRAHVRARQAYEAAMRGNCPFIAQVALLLDMACELALGGARTMDEARLWGPASSGVIDLARLLASSQGYGPRDAVRLDVLSKDACPHDLGWLVSILACDLGPVSEAVLPLIPEPWIKPLSHQRHAAEAFFGIAASRPARARRRGSAAAAPRRGEDGAKRVRVNILGGFEVLVDGKQVDAAKFQGRKGRELLTLLCAAPGHKVRRYEALDSIWGSTDYVNGLHRIYEATSGIRTAVGAKERGCDPLISSKSEGTIALNMDVVGCDIDDFVREARGALEGGISDKLVMAHADAMCAMMPEGFDEAMAASQAAAEARVARLRSLFADAAVAGADAALRLNRLHAAARMAQAAGKADGLREDAAIDLVRALGELGRMGEMRKAYDRFVNHYITATKMPPSRRLRETFDAACGHGRGLQKADDAGVVDCAVSA